MAFQSCLSAVFLSICLKRKAGKWSQLTSADACTKHGFPVVLKRIPLQQCQLTSRQLLQSSLQCGNLISTPIDSTRRGLGSVNRTELQHKKHENHSARQLSECHQSRLSSACKMRSKCNRACVNPLVTGSNPASTLLEGKRDPPSQYLL